MTILAASIPTEKGPRRPDAASLQPHDVVPASWPLLHSLPADPFDLLLAAPAYQTVLDNLPEPVTDEFVMGRIAEKWPWEERP
jgi:hypothetical protein